MNVSLTKELEGFIHNKVESGLYHSASEVIRNSLRLMIEMELTQQRRLATLNAEIHKGLESLNKEPKSSWQVVKADLTKNQ